jgi:hypothetical protein
LVGVVCEEGVVGSEDVVEGVRSVGYVVVERRQVIAHEDAVVSKMVGETEDTTDFTRNC